MPFSYSINLQWVICIHRAKVFTASLRAVKFVPAVASQILPLSLTGERNFLAKLDSPKAYTASCP